MTKYIIIFAVLALAGLGAATLWPEKAGKPVATAEYTWPEFSMNAVGEIDFKSDNDAFTLVSRQGRWRVDLPNRDTDPLADKEKIVSLVEFVRLNKPKNRLDGIENAAKYGLESPRARIRFNDKATILLGSDEPAGSGVYASLKGEPEVLLLPNEYVQKLMRKSRYFFDMSLFGIREENVRSVSLESVNGEDWKISIGKEKYEFAAPEDKIGQPVSVQEADLFLHTLLTAKATDLLFSEPPGPLDELVAITISSEGDSETLSVSAAGEGLVGRSDHQPLPFKLDPELRAKLVKSAFAMTDRRILSLDLGKITRLKLSGGERELLAERVDNLWQLAGEESKELLGIDMNLWRLTDLKYESSPSDVRPESARHALTLTLRGKKDETVEKLEFYTDPELPEGLAWIAISNDDAYYPVSARLYEDLAGLLPPAAAEGRKAKQD